MEVRDWITIASALIIAIGWFVTGYLNRVKDVAQKRLEYRLKMLEAFLPVWFAITEDGNALLKPEVQEQLLEARNKFALYGLKDENDIMNQHLTAITNKDIAETNKTLRELALLVQTRIRKELKINGRIQL